MKLLSAFVTLFAIFAVASPSSCARTKPCKTTSAKLVLPAGQTNLTAPTGDPSFVLLGVGYQNYTCNASGRYASAGAVAFLFDLSCLSQKDSAAFDKIQDPVFEFWSKAPSLDSKSPPLHSYPKLGEHFFQSNGNGSIAPVWDFRGDSAPNQPNAFVVAARVAGLAAPTGPADVDWVELKRVSGDLGEKIYRTHTKGGQPPASCTPGSDGIKVKYVSKYWLYGGSITIS